MQVFIFIFILFYFIFFFFFFFCINEKKENFLLLIARFIKIQKTTTVKSKN